MNHLANIIACFLLVATTSGYCQDSEATPSNEHGKKTQDAHAKVLRKTEATVGPFVFNPPKGWEKKEISKIMTAWIGTEREDGFTPHMLFTVIQITDTVENDKLIKSMLRGVEKRRKEWKHTEIQKITINGLNFLSSTWSGMNPVAGKKMSGEVYSMVVGKMCVCMQVQDLDSHAKDTIMKAKAALSTFKKK